MTNEVQVPVGDEPSDTATLLLAAAQEQGYDPYVVRTTSDGVFIVPEEVAKAADLDYDSEDDDTTVSDADEDKPKPAKKTAAKKAVAKKTTAK